MSPCFYILKITSFDESQPQICWKWDRKCISVRSVWSECSVCSWRLSSVSLAVQQTTACSKLITSQGRGRFFIRLMLMRRTLGNVIKHLLHTNRVIEVSGHSSDSWKLFFLQTINIISYLHSGIALMLLFWEMRSLLVSFY